MVNYTHLFYLGYLYNEMRDLRGRPVKPRLEEWTVLWILDQFKKHLKLFNIRNSDINDLVDKWLSLLSQKYKEGEYLSEDDARGISSGLSAIWDYFVNEVLQSTPIYVETITGFLNPNLLRRGLKDIVGSNIYNKLPVEVRDSLEDSIKALRIGLWTPATLSVLRAIEITLREYYVKIMGKQPRDDKGSILSWSQILNDIVSSGRVKKTIVGYLDFLDARRKEAEDPEKRFTRV